MIGKTAIRSIYFQNLARILYKAAAAHGDVNPHDIEKILHVTRDEVITDTGAAPEKALGGETGTTLHISTTDACFYCNICCHPLFSVQQPIQPIKKKSILLKKIIDWISRR